MAKPVYKPQGKKQRAEGFGRFAEGLAALWLRLKGYRILESRYKTPAGEIDLIVRKGDITCFVEVKARASLDTAAHALSPKQQQRIARAASLYLQRKGLVSETMRFDAILLAPWRLPRHIPQAWNA